MGVVRSRDDQKYVHISIKMANKKQHPSLLVYCAIQISYSQLICCLCQFLSVEAQVGFDIFREKSHDTMDMYRILVELAEHDGAFETGEKKGSAGGGISVSSYFLAFEAARDDPFDSAMHLFHSVAGAVAQGRVGIVGLDSRIED